MNSVSAYVLGLEDLHGLMLGADEGHEERTFRAGSIGRFIKKQGLRMQAGGDFQEYAGMFGIDAFDPFEYQKFLDYGKSMTAFHGFLGPEAYHELLALPEVQDR